MKTGRKNLVPRLVFAASQAEGSPDHEHPPVGHFPACPLRRSPAHSDRAAIPLPVLAQPAKAHAVKSIGKGYAASDQTRDRCRPRLPLRRARPRRLHSSSRFNSPAAPRSTGDRSRPPPTAQPSSTAVSKALTDVKTAQGKFSQLDAQGRRLHRRLLHQPSGQDPLRIHDTPEPIFIVSDGTTVSTPLRSRAQASKATTPRRSAPRRSATSSCAPMST